MALVRHASTRLRACRQLFATALAMQQRVELLERIVQIAGESSQQIGQGLLDQGVGPRSDVLLLEIELAKAEANVRSAARWRRQPSPTGCGHGRGGTGNRESGGRPQPAPRLRPAGSAAGGARPKLSSRVPELEISPMTFSTSVPGSSRFRTST